MPSPRPACRTRCACHRPYARRTWLSACRSIREPPEVDAVECSAWPDEPKCESLTSLCSNPWGLPRPCPRSHETKGATIDEGSLKPPSGRSPPGVYCTTEKRSPPPSRRESVSLRSVAAIQIDMPVIFRHAVFFLSSHASLSADIASSLVA
jgi:hypothetical protein